MPYVSVHVDASDVLSDLTDKELEEEIARRRTKRGEPRHMADWCIPQPIAKYTLEEAADIFRREGKHSLAFKLDEIRCDYVEH